MSRECENLKVTVSVRPSVDQFVIVGDKTRFMKISNAAPARHETNIRRATGGEHHTIN